MQRHFVNLFCEQMTSDNLKMREFAASICRDYLHGAWKYVNAQSIGFNQISGGLSNLVYCISLPETLSGKEISQSDPKEVLIRIYGQHALEAVVAESVIFTLLSERGLAPKLHGIFPGGRIEQYINARPLKTKELADGELSVIIAQKMAAIHCMQVPLHKTAGRLSETMERWLKSSEKRLKGEVPEHVRHLIDVDLRKEAAWLRQQLERENSPVVFCHNDMQEGNILIHLDDNVENNFSSESKIILIDFEYCSYNYRAFDIANHFAEWMYDYTEKEHPFFKTHPKNYPTECQMLRFIRAYLDETCSKENPQQLLQEVEVFTLASHFFWALWSIVNTERTQTPFGYWEYGAARLDAYFNMRNNFLERQGIETEAPELE